MVNPNNSKILVIAGPTGSGKTTIQTELLKRNPKSLCKIITCTSRSLRSNEKQGDPYCFLSQSEFEAKINNGEFLEWVKYDNSYYGTPKDAFLGLTATPVAIMDLRGVIELIELYPNRTEGILIYAGFETLKSRLSKRTDSSYDRASLLLANELEEFKEVENIFTLAFDNDIYDLDYICTSIEKKFLL